MALCPPGASPRICRPFRTVRKQTVEQTMTDPVPAQKEPYNVSLEAGKSYAWCACGLSQSQPYCDGSHKGTGLTPVVFKQEGTEEAWLCGCKATKDQPFCDGTHNSL